MENMRNVTVAVIVGMLSACATPTNIKAYSGPDLPKDQIALLKPTVGVQVIALDGDKAFGVKTAQSVGYLEVEMAVPAGNHKIEVMLNHGDILSKGTTVLELIARPEHRYLINYTMVGRTWSPRIEDVTDRPDRWCALASSTNFKGCSK